MNWTAFVIGVAAIAVAVYVNDDDNKAPAELWAYVKANHPEVAEAVQPYIGGGVDSTDEGLVSHTGKKIRRVTHTEVEEKEHAKAKTQYPRLDADDFKDPTYLWSKAELKLRNGMNANRELLISIAGEVYDVGTGTEYYAPEMGYAGMSGRDCSKGFATGEYVDEEGGLAGMSPQQIKTILDWRKFYREHETYRFVGLLEGDYFNADMSRTVHLKTVEGVYNEQLAQAAHKEDLFKTFKPCNTKFEQNNPKVKLWCDDSYHQPGATPGYMITKFRDEGLPEPSRVFLRMSGREVH
eukprot:TRINITY_DN26327_c0_g1_i1.p1 TRINITY_DN26327_c0_g1~~TRINITY_DN26327_c0_g1_i1.p1  ORF type:complete len:295 (+),score=118.31 TRINITY_DN26327_c0_g1_i1:236-1120(+)